MNTMFDMVADSIPVCRNIGQQKQLPNPFNKPPGSLCLTASKPLLGRMLESTALSLNG